MPDELSGKTALVTGGSRGIGRAIAVALARAGAKIGLGYRDRHGDAEEARAAVEACGSPCLTVAADVSLASDVSRMVDAVQRVLGPVLILVNNAGISRPQPPEEIRERDWDEIIAANLKSQFLVTQAVLPSMRAHHWGRIINVSSVAAHTGGVVGPHYAASKAGVLGLTHSYAALLAGEGITVNAVSPALIYTEMVAANPRARPDLIPAGRFGTVEETAEAVLMLVRNGYITGQTIHVNGGWYMT